MGKGGKAPEYQTTTTSSPYATSTTTKNGTTVKLNDFLNNSNAFVESNMPSLYNQLLNPSLDNPVTKAKSDIFNKAFTEQSQKAFENNLINPLASRNMTRSSAATNMYNNFAKDQNDTISDFNNELIANNTSDTSALINQLMNIYLMGANIGNQAISNSQNQSNQVSSYNSDIYKAQQAANAGMWNNISNLGSSALGAGGSVGTAAILASDINVKKNINKIGEKGGYNLYEFEYKDGLGLPKGKQTGVIAQEVEKINPDAVVEINGIKHVDYSKL